MAVGGSFQGRLKQKIEELKKDKQEGVLRGSPEDYSRYREQVGYFRALEDILLLCGETESDMNKGN